MKQRNELALVLAAVGLTAASPAHAQGDPASTDPVRRGEYVFDAAGCVGCHTAEDGAPLAGGRILETPFGTFYGPNISPHPEFGIGGWTEEQFRAALRDGKRPEGGAYYPSFPYTSFTRMTDGDITDLKAFLDAQPAQATPSRPHELKFPFGARSLMEPWRWMNFEPGPIEPDPTRSAEWNRGRYLVEALVHCGECHTPRGSLGAVDGDFHLAGNPEGPDGAEVPNITPDAATGIGGWSPSDIETYLEMGMTPDGDFAGGAMAEVIEHSTSRLTSEDRRAIATYLQSLPPIAREIE